MLARYSSGARFSVHVDAASPNEAPLGQPPDPRVVTAIAYVSEPRGGWREAHGGALRIYAPGGDAAATSSSLGVDAVAAAAAAEGAGVVDVPPRRGSLVLFWSALVRHEVLAAHAERLALSMWFHEPRPRPSADDEKE